MLHGWVAGTNDAQGLAAFLVRRECKPGFYINLSMEQSGQWSPFVLMVLQLFRVFGCIGALFSLLSPVSRRGRLDPFALKLLFLPTFSSLPTISPTLDSARLSATGGLDFVLFFYCTRISASPGRLSLLL